MLVTLAQMKAYLKIPITDTDNDVFLTLQISTISEAIEAYTRRKFKAANYQEVFYEERASLFPRNILYLSHYPIIRIDAFEDVYSTLPAATRADVVGYRLHKPSGRIMDFNHTAYFGSGNFIEIDYRAGYEIIPAPILSVVYSLVGERFNKQKLGIDLSFGSDVQSINIPGTIGIQFDYSLQGNERSSVFGVILGNYLNVLDYYRSDRAILGSDKLAYVEEVI